MRNKAILFIYVLLVIFITSSSAAVTPQVSAGNQHTVGLKTDGTVVAVGKNYYGQCNVSYWNMISASDESIRIVSWNILNYPDSNEESREEYFRSVIESLSPDSPQGRDSLGLCGL